MRNLHLSTAVFVTFAGFACVDANPLPGPAVDAGIDADQPPPVDDAGDAPDPIADCFACANAPAPGCVDPLGPCSDDAKCGPALECSVRAGCYALPNAEILRCVIPCATPAGIVDPKEHAADLLSAISVCLDTNCKVACGGTPP